MNKQGKDKIEYLDYTWNPVTGCMHPCKDKYCYAAKIARRFGGADISVPQDNNKFRAIGKGLYEVDEPLEKYISQSGKTMAAPYPFGFKPTFHRYRLDEPVKVKKPSIIGVVYMGDLFGDWVPDEWIQEIFNACEAAPQHTYMFLTKNPEKYGKINGWNHRYDWSIANPNWWFGITVTCQDDLKRLRHLPYGQANTFISIEPVQSNIDLSFFLPDESTKWQCSYCGHNASNYSLHCQNCGKHGGYSGSFRKHPINWIIIGQQTGPGAKPPKPEWVQSIIDQARAAGVPVFVKHPLYEQFPIQEWPEGLR